MITCPLCNTPAPPKGRVADLDVYFCGRCSLLFTEPIEGRTPPLEVGGHPRICPVCEFRPGRRVGGYSLGRLKTHAGEIAEVIHFCLRCRRGFNTKYME